MLNSKKATLFIIFIFLFPFITGNASPLTQTIKGRVIDRQTKTGLAGANVLIQNTEKGAATDIEGYFSISKVPIGRQSLKIFYIGYKPAIIPEILVGSAKEIDLTIELEEDVIQNEEIVITPKIEKNKPLNTMSIVSARSFSVEETQRYAGGFDDPARLVSSFAGVTYGNAQDNAIIIRGNAPKGLLWRLEGIDIPNPNHFPDGNILGGGLFTIFSNQLLSNSDFFTSAFPAEFGNALSGVFDIKFRNGNNDRREWTFQTGLMGIDFSAEGPFSKNHQASYLVNYRYSTIGLLTDLKIVDTDQELHYQDLSFKVNIPTQNAGVFSLWGIGSYDAPKETEEKDPTRWEHDWDRLRYDSKIKVGAFGFNHKYAFGRSTYLNSTLAATAKDMLYNLKRIDDNLTLRQNENINSFNGKLTLNSIVSHKFNSRLYNKTGFIINYLAYNLNLASAIDDIPETYQTFVDEKGNSQLIQAFSQTQAYITPNLKINAGIHYQIFLLNNNISLEPRAGISWSFSSRHSISFGYGRHGQLENIRYYLAQKQTAAQKWQPNKNLDFTHADHLALSYDLQLTNNIRVKIEPYYQYLFDVPVRANDSFSFINLKDERYFNDPLMNKGKGVNRGIDFTLERFLSDDYYYLFTASLFDSKYKGGDGIKRNSRYNRNYVINALLGKEIYINNKNILGLNIKFTSMGGEKTSPILYNESLAAKRVIYDETRAFEESLSGNNYLDISIHYRINQPGISHIFSLQIKNLLGSANDYGYIYNYAKQNLTKDKMVIVLPSISYKIEF